MTLWFPGGSCAKDSCEGDPYAFYEPDQQSPVAKPKSYKRRAGQSLAQPPAKALCVSGAQGSKNAAANGSGQRHPLQPSLSSNVAPAKLPASAHRSSSQEQGLPAAYAPPPLPPSVLPVSGPQGHHSSSQGNVSQGLLAGSKPFQDLSNRVSDVVMIDLDSGARISQPQSRDDVDTPASMVSEASSDHDLAVAVESLVLGATDDRCSSAPDSAVGDLHSPEPAPSEDGKMTLYSNAYDTVYGYGVCLLSFPRFYCCFSLIDSIY